MPRSKLVLTHFDPFGGATINASRAAAHVAAEILSLDFDVRVVELPTVYDRATEVALEAISDFERDGERVAAVVSLGEGRCRVALETMAHNRDDKPDLADNAGVFRSHSLIEVQGPASVKLPFPVESTFELIRREEGWSADEIALIQLSADPGTFVCNNTAYQMARYFSGFRRETAYTFIHVPNHRCAGELHGAPVAASIVARMIRAAIR